MAAKGKAKKNLPKKEVKFVEGTEVQIPENLPLVIRGQPMKEEGAIIIASFICDLYATNKFPLSSCMSYAGVRSEATFFAWVRKFKAVKALYEDSKLKKAAIYRTKLRELAITSLEKQISGYKVELKEVTEEIEYIEGEASEDGNSNPGPKGFSVTSRKIKTKQVYVRPSPTATIAALVNLDKANFQRNPSAEEKDEEFPVDIPLIDWVDNPKEPES